MNGLSFRTPAAVGAGFLAFIVAASAAAQAGPPETSVILTPSEAPPAVVPPPEAPAAVAPPSETPTVITPPQG